MDEEEIRWKGSEGEESEKWESWAEGEGKKNAIQQRSKGKEDGGLQVHGVNPHLSSHMIPPLHKAYRQMDEQTDRERQGEERGKTWSVLGRRNKVRDTQTERPET